MKKNSSFEQILVVVSFTNGHSKPTLHTPKLGFKINYPPFLLNRPPPLQLGTGEYSGAQICWPIAPCFWKVS